MDWITPFHCIFLVLCNSALHCTYCNLTYCNCIVLYRTTVTCYKNTTFAQKGESSTVQYSSLRICDVAVWYSITVQFYTIHYCRCYLRRESNTYLFSSRNVLMTEATVKRLRFGWTLSPASLIVKPWFTTWSTNVALMLSDITLRWPLTTRPPLSCPRPPPPLTLTLPRALPPSMLAKFSKRLKLGLFCCWLIGVQFWRYGFSGVNQCLTNHPMCFMFWIYVFSKWYDETSFFNGVSYEWKSVQWTFASVLYKGQSVLLNCYNSVRQNFCLRYGTFCLQYSNKNFKLCYFGLSTGL